MASPAGPNPGDRRLVKAERDEIANRARESRGSRDGWLFWIGLLVLLATPTAAIAGKLALGGATLACAVGLFLVAFSRRDEFALLKAAGVELRRAERVVEEANATAKQLRATTTALAQVALVLLARAGIQGTVRTDEKLRLAEAMKESLSQVGLTKSEINDLAEPVMALVRFRHVQAIEQALFKVLGKHSGDRRGLEPRHRDAMSAAGRIRDMLDGQSFAVPQPSIVRRVLEEFHVSDPDVLETVEDYEHLCSTGELRRTHALDSELSHLPPPILPEE